MDIQTFRAEYPQYADLADQDLAMKLHKSLFADLPLDQFLAAFLGGQPQPAQMTGMEQPQMAEDMPMEQELTQQDMLNGTIPS